MWWLGSLPAATAQTQVPFNQRDDQYRLLGLKRAKEAYEVARSEYERQKDLFARNLITKADVERARSLYADAEVNYQQSLLAVLFEQQYVSVLEAVKYQAEDGHKHVRLKIANMSGGSAEFRKLIEIEDELFRALQPDVVHNVYVSILNDEGAIISQPYEAKVERLRYGEPRTLDFALLQELDAVTVYLIYSNGTERNFKVFLQKDATVNRVAVQAEQFSQEVQLGASATYGLTFELFSGESDTYGLEVVNLPDVIARYFSDPSGRVRLSQIKFTESTRTKPATLEVTLPDRPSEAVVMDEPIAFYALVIPRAQRRELGDPGDKTWTEDEIKALDVGYTRLELVPRGKGELRVRAPLLFHSITAGETVRMIADLYNEGSHRIDHIAFDVELPLEWDKEIVPAAVSALGIGEEKRVEFTFLPPDDVPEGKYDIRLRTTGTSDNQPVEGEDKTITVEVRGQTSVLAAALILVLLIGVVGGVVVFAVRLSRR
jgi:uncharacterized membrane protein